MYIRAAWKARQQCQLRAWEGLSITRMARDLGFSREKLANILAGRKVFVRPIELVRIAEALKLTREELLARIDYARSLDQQRLALEMERTRRQLEGMTVGRPSSNT